MNSLYIHIPFCKYICSYCDFCKKYVKNYDVNLYLENLEKEMKLYGVKDEIKTIYIGGGTPSVLTPDQLIKLNKMINDNFNVSKDCEFSIESNPDDLNEDFLLAIKGIGVNRLSIGMQTTNEKILKLLNRGHKLKDVQDGLKMASEYIENISIDLMFNLPNQTLEDIDDSLNFIKENDQYLKHISFYGLIFEEHTILNTKEYEYLTEEEEVNWYLYIQKKLEDLGYIQYEISNYSKLDYNSIHNRVYWENKNYLGLGLGASSFINNTRFTNTKSVKQYYEKLNNGIKPIVFEEVLSKRELDYDHIMLGLRTIEGIDYNIVKELNIDFGKYKIEENRISIRKEDFYFSNQLILDILEEL